MSAPLPDEAYAVALLGLPALWPDRLAAMLGQRRAGYVDATDLFGAPAPGGPERPAADVWELVREGRALQIPGRLRALLRSEADAAVAAWAVAAREVDVARVWASIRRDGIRVDLLGSPGYPPELVGDRRAPYVLFRVGAPSLEGRRVAIVGTRRCTPLGRELAAEIGRDLTAAGVRVVSGLALGIDGAAHQAALAAGGAPIGVVAGGFDRPYPIRHTGLWHEVRTHGVLVSEWPPGIRSEGWRFPARNRIIASLSEAVVVVESRETGGSMITAEEAVDRDVPVLVIPGSVRNPSAAGVNKLLRDGAHPVMCADDVLLAIGLGGQNPPAAAEDRRPPPIGQAGRVLDAVGWEPTPTDRIIERSGVDRGGVVSALVALEIDGWVAGGGGSWQRV